AARASLALSPSGTLAHPLRLATAGFGLRSLGPRPEVGDGRELAEGRGQRWHPGTDERGRVGRGHAGPVEHRLQHAERLGAELVEVVVAGGAGAEVHLDDGVGAHGPGDVDEQPDVDAVAPDEREALEQLPASPELTRQR